MTSLFNLALTISPISLQAIWTVDAAIDIRACLLSLSTR
eukprot:CAMPEP_0175033742 /NCGR_PEP_ID=MMETSP0005-20121125/22195_1 /TAXON_ID=420556 /ORGANISM="Ochromonas sp., Strain CCMP1393" /LENGTH=38 /DNA_ID= /DNA_START= /DNA_END= /DNA_ORIENTATION=